MKVPGSQHEQLVDCQLEKVQEVGAYFPTVSEKSDLSNQWHELKERDLSYNALLLTLFFSFCNLKKHSQELLQKL